MSYFRFVPHRQIVRRLAEGWTIADDLHGTHHGHHAVLMKWTGDHEPG